VKFAFYPGCIVQTEQYGYEISARKIFPKLGIDLIDIKGFNCCGYPLKNVSVPSWLYLSARNLALAEKNKLDLFPLCNGCYLSFIEAKHYLSKDLKLRRHLNSILSEEELEYNGDVKCLHILQILRDRVGIKKVSKEVIKPLKGLKLAAHYGCHALRPSKLGMPDDSEDPECLEYLIEALGAESGNYPERLDCCGQGLAMTTGKIALAISGNKLKAIQDHMFDGVVTICPFCMKMLDAKQKAIRISTEQKDVNIPVVYYTQLLGLAMGIKAEKLAINLNQSPVWSLLRKLETTRVEER
jgi:heterodisulfide reductase subunit B